jgi:hypothetical protein
MSEPQKHYVMEAETGYLGVVMQPPPASSHTVPSSTEHVQTEPLPLTEGKDLYGRIQ